MALQVSSKCNRVKPTAVCNPMIYIATGVMIALPTHRYPEMSDLHSKLLTENVVKIKYAFLIYLFQRKTAYKLFFF